MAEEVKSSGQKWLFVFAALSGIGGALGALIAFLVWFGIKPKDILGWSVHLTLPQWLWLLLAVILFLFSLLSSVYVLFRNQQLKREQTLRVSESHRLQQELVQIQGKRSVELTAALNEKAQAGNRVSELERQLLEEEQKTLAKAQDAWRRGFVTPKWEVVEGHNFVNTSIEIDGKAFRHCRFESVTFTFHGKAPAEFTSDNHFAGNKLRFDTDDPAVMAFMQLRMIVERIPGASIVTGALDARGILMPENFRITVPPAATGETLQSDPRKEAEALSDEIRQFVASLGPRPERKDSRKQHSETEELEAIREHGAILHPWLQRLQAGWLGRFEDRAQKIRHLLVERGITDIDLDMALRARTADEKRFVRIADRLLLLSRAAFGG